ncbi:hypothetical protein, variant 2 [Aphanomyces astaci]|uniref:BZIP domain-containing protein n=1 Tax=Aphanomyces astaci TaxID=112090 RepID=W4GBE7_APHAT|nr:hypothetical protein, variant 2 [Aphanomyces astaci]ETV76990.1 hypothetical protein, variant 2 [Aphanomyces astaci]|eukprot:XP_009833302.1 hypothetical protein, variant 2 [Aphanomyces astaci]
MDNSLESEMDVMFQEVEARPMNGKGKVGGGHPKDPYEKKKEYNRMRNKKLREAERQEVTTLRNQANELERLIKALAKRRRGNLLENGDDNDGNAMGMLPWKDVSSIFKALTASSETERQNLTHKVDTYYNVAAVMHQWVHSSHHLPVMPDTFKQTWRNSTLVAHESSRLLGFDWIAKQLYHNIDMMIQHCGLPASLAECSDVRIYPLENQNSYHMSKARQRIEDATLEEVVQVLRRQYFEGKADTMDSPDPNVRYFRNKSSYGSTSQNAYSQNILMRQFVEANRYVVFAHSITEDEKFPVDRIQRNWTNWTVAERMGSSTIIKQMAVASGLRMNETFLPFDVDPAAAATASSVDMDHAFLTFKHKTEVYHKYIFAKEVVTFRNLLAQVRADNANLAVTAFEALDL